MNVKFRKPEAVTGNLLADTIQRSRCGRFAIWAKRYAKGTTYTVIANGGRISQHRWLKTARSHVDALDPYVYHLAWIPTESLTVTDPEAR